MKRSAPPPTPKQSNQRLQELSRELLELEERLRLGGGLEKIEKQHQQGKLTARERIAYCRQGSFAQEIG